MTPQEIFDKAVGGVIRQGSLAKGENNVCRYRTKDGRACVVGQLIDDDLAHQWDDRCDPAFLIIWRYDPDEIPVELRPHIQLLTDLQQAHDDASTTLRPFECFHDLVRQVANTHNLEFKF